MYISFKYSIARSAGRPNLNTPSHWRCLPCQISYRASEKGVESNVTCIILRILFSRLEVPLYHDPEIHQTVCIPLRNHTLLLESITNLTIQDTSSLSIFISIIRYRSVEYPRGIQSICVRIPYSILFKNPKGGARRHLSANS